MADMQHTPGPWAVADEWESRPHARGISERAILVVAEDTVEPVVCWVAEVSPEAPAVVHARELANAHLIAAAPDLLACAVGVVGDCYVRDIATGEMVCVFCSQEQSDPHLAACPIPPLTAAIAKAEGH